MKIKGIWNGNILHIGQYHVKWLKDDMYGVFNSYETLITSDTTFPKACKKAKLLALGYEAGWQDRKDMNMDEDW